MRYIAFISLALAAVSGCIAAPSDPDLESFYEPAADSRFDCANAIDPITGEICGCNCPPPPPPGIVVTCATGLGLVYDPTIGGCVNDPDTDVELRPIDCCEGCPGPDQPGQVPCCSC